MSEQIEGVPEGWRLVAIRRVKNGEWFIERHGRIDLWKEPDDETSCWVHPVIEKIEQSKQYRQFANAAEFEQHRDRWWRFKDESDELFSTYYYSDNFHMWNDWRESFDKKVFADGSPFGVEVME